jgi:hypothetical protein
MEKRKEIWQRINKAGNKEDTEERKRKQVRTNVKGEGIKRVESSVF